MEDFLRRRRGFSLIELVIVVIIIGVISAIAIPRLSRGSEGAAVNAFVSEINNYANAIDRYRLETGNDVPDTTSGVFPSALSEYIREKDWSSTPIGGQWDIEANGIGGHALSIGVHYNGESPRLATLEQVDQAPDDGDLNTGNFRLIGANRYYLILEP